MSADQEIDRISQAKSDIKAAIERKGVSVGDGRIDTYAQKIDQITGGGGYPEPTGTINITENGDNIDVKDYATANVNVSGGGGGIPDKEFIQQIVGNDVVFPVESSKSLTPPSGSLWDARLWFYFDSGSESYASVPAGMPLTNFQDRSWARSNPIDYYSAFHQNGYAEGTLTIGSKTLDIKTPYPLDGGYHALSGTNLCEVPYVYTEFDFDHAVQDQNGPHTLRLRYSNTYYPNNVTGEVYFVPLVTNDSNVTNFGEPVSFWDSGTITVQYGNLTEGYCSQPPIGLVRDQAFWTTQKTFFSNAEIWFDNQTDCEEFYNNGVGAVVMKICQIDNPSASAEYDFLKTGLWCAIFVKTGKTLQDFIDTVTDTSIYRYGITPFISMFASRSGSSSMQYPIMDGLQMHEALTELRANPNGITVSTDSNTELSIAPIGKTSRFLHEFVDNMRIGTIRHTDYEQGIFDEDHIAVYGTDDDLDLTNIDVLSDMLW